MNKELQEKLKKVINSSALKAVFQWAGPVRTKIILICLLGMVSSLLSLLVTMATKRLIDGAIASNLRDLWMYGAVLTGLVLGERGLAVWIASIRLQASTAFQRHLQGMVTASILGKEYAGLRRFHSGELVSRVFSDVNVVKNGVMSLLPSLARMAVSFVGAAVLLVAMDWRFVPLLILTGIAGSFFTVLLREPMKRRHKRMQQAEARLHAGTQETMENVHLIKASVSERRALDILEEERNDLQRQQVRNGRMGILMNNGMGVVFDLSWLACNLWGCIKIFQGSFTYGSLAALIQLMGEIQAPIADAVDIAREMYAVIASSERLLEVVGLPEEQTGTELTDFDEIRLENVSFQYADGNEEVLKGLNGVVHRGEFVALTGLSGGGKSSLFQLLLGIYKPNDGLVLFKQGEVTVPACRGTRKLFAYVPQGNTLMSGTLRDNLTLFAEKVGEEEIRKAVHAACLDPLVAEIGLDAMLGERGIGLSEGQAQRVAIARALLSGAPILLLDESTSALDEATEALLLQNIGKMRGKTVLIVTHRPAALEICDYEYHLQDGRLIRRPDDS